MNHIIQKKISFNEASLFTFICLSSDPKTAVLHSNASILSSEWSLPLRQVQYILAALKSKKYIYYEDPRGVKGPHEIFVNKYPVKLERTKWNIPVWFSDIWDKNGVFIGRDYFYAQLKLRNLPPVSTVSDVVSDVVSISGFDLKSDLVLNFDMQFEEYEKILSFLRGYPLLCRWLSDFDWEFEEYFEGQFDGRPYKIQIHIQKPLYKKQTFKETAKCEYVDNSDTGTEYSDISDIIEKLRNLNHGFNPEYILNIMRKIFIPEDVIKDTFIALVRKHKAGHLVNSFGYLIGVLDKKYTDRSYATDIKKYLSKKKQTTKNDSKLFLGPSEPE